MRVISAAVWIGSTILRSACGTTFRTFCAEAGKAGAVAVATDSEAVFAAVEKAGGRAVMTRADHVSGSDRIFEALQQIDPNGRTRIVVNVQGDEPLIDPALIDAVAAALLSRPDAAMSTAVHAIDSVADYLNPNVVKAVLDAQGNALYFSRAPIPWWRDGAAPGVPPARLPSPAPLRHIGIYGYRAGFVRQFPALPPSPLEGIEALEQLRALWHGHRIAVHVSDAAPGPGVDTPEDLARVRALFAATT